MAGLRRWFKRWIAVEFFHNDVRGSLLQTKHDIAVVQGTNCFVVRPCGLWFSNLSLDSGFKWNNGRLLGYISNPGSRRRRFRTVSVIPSPDSSKQARLRGDGGSLRWIRRCSKGERTATKFDPTGRRPCDAEWNRSRPTHLRAFPPGSKILFVSQESSHDVVKQALSVGALGCVVKTDARRDLLSAIKCRSSG
jgi:hypothetical protein